ncbi:MAG: nuclear transport factor 2 family protein, partial [Magnetospirillum sp.]|nr:nuclear transport factor 2 family protein [Magnetospirillum sp.]
MAVMQDDGWCQAYRQFLETLDAATVTRLDDLVGADVHYHDPFIDIRGRDTMKRVLGKMFEDVDSPRYTFTAMARDGDTCLLRWHFTCRP